MRYHKAVNLLVLFNIIFFIASANAGYSSVSRVRKKNYIRVAAGYSYSPDKHGNINKARSNGAFLGSIGVGYIINSKFRADVTASYSGKYKYKTTTSAGTESHDANNVRLMLNGYWHFKHLYEKYSKSSTLCSPYLMAGIGYANNIVDNMKVISAAGTEEYISKQKRNLAWQIGLGALFDINKNIDIDLLYKYVDLGKVTSRGVHSIPTMPGTFKFATSRLKGELTAHEFSIGCHFKFN